MDSQTASVDADGLARLSILQYLRQAGAELDRQWVLAAQRGDDDALRLADASQAVHRATMALAS